MYISIDDLKKIFSQAVSMEEYAASISEKEPIVVLRDYDEPTKAPCFDKDVKIFEFGKDGRPADDVRSAYGTKGSIPAANVINAIKAALGPSGYQLHISDGSYTDYSIYELKEYMTRCDCTDLKVWIAEVFDCDDFAQVLQGKVNCFYPGIAFGTIWYGPKKPPAWGHAVNIFYNNADKKIYLVEPQNDTFYEFNKNLWQAWMVII